MARASSQLLVRSLRGFRVEVQFLLGLYQTAPATDACQGVHERCREWCLVYLHDAWTRYCRRVVLGSASREPTSLGGVTIPRVAGVTHEDQAALVATTAMKLRYEPRWGDAKQALDAAKALGISNFTQVSAALGSTPSPADDVRVIRNFIAHRNRATALELNAVRLRHSMPDRLPDFATLQLWTRQLESIASAAIR